MAIEIHLLTEQLIRSRHSQTAKVQISIEDSHIKAINRVILPSCYIQGTLPTFRKIPSHECERSIHPRETTGYSLPPFLLLPNYIKQPCEGRSPPSYRHAIHVQSPFTRRWQGIFLCHQSPASPICKAPLPTS